MNPFRRARLFLSLGAIASYPTSGSAGLTFNGNVPDLGSLVAILRQLQNGGMSSGLNTNFGTSAGTTITLTNLGNLTQRLTAGSATTVTLDYAYNIVNSLPVAFLGQTFGFSIITNAATTVATPTLLDTAVTLSGTTTVLAAAERWYSGTITQMTTNVGFVPDTGTTWTSLTQVSSGNGYTVALGVNATVPVVGTAIYLGVTAGTLPAGWYPIVKVTSATSFIIAAPIAGTAWTATAVTFGTSNSAPAVFNPLITITGMKATVTATMSV